MRVAILSRSKSLHSIRRLLAEAKKQRLQCDVIDPLDCQIVVDGRDSRLMTPAGPIGQYDVILPRIGASITDYGLAVVKQFELLGSHPVNGSQAIAESRDKLRCLQVLAAAGVAVPSSVLCHSPRGLRLSVDSVGGMPVVLKVLQGTQGKGVMIVHSPISLGSVHETLKSLDQDVIIQQFLAEGAGRDYRAFVIGNRIVAAMLRTAPPGEFRANIHRGGEGTLVKLPPSFERTAIRSARVLGLEIAGVDLMESPRGPVVLEVNSSPGFEGIEKATGLNVAGMIVKHLKSSRRRRR